MINLDKGAELYQGSGMTRAIQAAKEGQRVMVFRHGRPNLVIEPLEEGNILLREEQNDGEGKRTGCLHTYDEICIF